MFKNIEELKNRIVDYLKDIIKNENNKNAIELINKSGYLATEAHGQIKVYTDREKTKKGSLHLAYCEISGADGRENNRHAKQFIKDNTIQSLLSVAAEEVEKDKLKLKEAESNKHLLINLQDKINNYFNSLSIDIENINVRFSDYNIEYYLNFSESIGDKYFNIYFKLQGNQYLYNDTYKEEKHIFKNVEEILKHFINEISPAVQKKISFLKMYSIVENNFKNNIDKKILFKNKDSFYTATIDNQYITLYEVNRKKEKPIYNYLYLKQFIDLFIKDNIDKFIIIDNNTDLSIKNLRNLISSNNNCIMIHEEAATDREENKINDLSIDNKIVERANNLIESLEINPGEQAQTYINYLKNKGIDSKDKNNKLVLAARVHLIKYGYFKTDAIAKAAEIEGVKSTKELEQKYFNKLVDILKNGSEEVEPIKEEFYNNNNNEVIEAPAAEETDNYFYSDINLNNILKHIEEVKDFNNSKSVEYFGSYGTPQRGSFRIEKNKYNDNNLYIKAMLETKENYFEKLEIFEEYNKAIDLYIEFLAAYQFDYIKYLDEQKKKEVEPAAPAAEQTEQEQQDRENKEYIYNFIEEHRHIEKIDPFIENNKIEYFVSIQNYIQVFYIDKDNYNFNAVIEDYQFIKRNVDSLEVEGLIQSAFSIMKNYKKYKVIDHNFIKYEIDIFQCIDLSISDIKDIIRIDNIKDITIESDLITMYKDNEVIAYVDIKKDIPGFTKYTDAEQKILLKYYYDKLTESNINYYLIDSKVINQ